MLKDFIIDFSDLTPRCQKDFIRFMGLEEGEIPYGPISVLSLEVDEEN